MSNGNPEELPHEPNSKPMCPSEMSKCQNQYCKVRVPTHRYKALKNVWKDHIYRPINIRANED